MQKLRRLLLETIENAVEHAYAEEQLGFVGIYARIRGQRPEALERARDWNKLISRERRECPTLKQFESNPQAPWLELFICDTGKGLLHAVHEWQQYVDDELKQAIARAMQSKNPLRAMSRLLFHQPLSRSLRVDTPRTSVTGLQYLGRVLSIDGDFARIYTNHEWAGSIHPWAPKQNGGLRTSRGSHDFEDKLPAPGTFYSFSIQPRQSEVTYDVHEWVLADLTARHRLIEILTGAALDSRPANIEFWDRRTANSCDVPTQWDAAPASTELPPVVVLRPPRSVTKRDFGRWLQALAGLPNIPAPRPAAPPHPEQEPIDFRLGRIYGTPFIGIDGERAISVTRFWPKDAEDREFHASYYGRNPQETYDDFEQLGVLKLGHWVYGSKHDLLTINLSRAFELSCLDNGR